MNIENYADAVLAVKMLSHRGHKVNIYTYGADDSNVVLECVKCKEVIIDYDITVQDRDGEFADVFTDANAQ
jgi:hypothetical protein